MSDAVQVEISPLWVAAFRFLMSRSEHRSVKQSSLWILDAFEGEDSVNDFHFLVCLRVRNKSNLNIDELGQDSPVTEG